MSENPILKIFPYTIEQTVLAEDIEDKIPWNVQKVNAPAVWG